MRVRRWLAPTVAVIAAFAPHADSAMGHRGAPFRTVGWMEDLNSGGVLVQTRCTGLDEGHGERFRHFVCLAYGPAGIFGGALEHAPKPVQSLHDSTYYQSLRGWPEDGGDLSMRRFATGRSPERTVAFVHRGATRFEVLAVTKRRRLMKVSFSIVCVRPSAGRWLTYRHHVRFTGTGWLKRVYTLPSKWAAGYCMSAEYVKSRGPATLAVKLTSHV